MKQTSKQVFHNSSIPIIILQYYGFIWMTIPLGTQFRYSLNSIDIEPVRYVACAKYAIP